MIIRSRIKGKYVAGVVGILLILGTLSLWTLGRDSDPHNAYIMGTVDRGSIQNTVSATGSLEAVRTVQVGSQTSGQIQALYADFNDPVRQGQLLATIDPRIFESQLVTADARLLSAQAKLRSAEADLLNQQANLLNAEANLDATRVSAETARLMFERAEQLTDEGLLSRSDHDVSKANADTAAMRVAQAEAAVEQAKAVILAKEAQIDQALAEVVQAEADVERAAINLELTNIYSPVDGVVISRKVDVGQTVAASLAAPVLFVIADDLTQMQVKASIDEADIGKINGGGAAKFTVDAYPNDVFTGTIEEIRLDPQTVQNVVTYHAIVGVENPQLKLKPGMTANITVTIESAEDVLTVANAALRYSPTGMTAEDVRATRGQRRGPGTETADPPIVRAKGSSGAQRARVWTVDESGQLKARRVETGITDGVRTALQESDLSEDDVVILGELTEASRSAKSGTASLPFNVGTPSRGRGIR